IQPQRLFQRFIADAFRSAAQFRPQPRWRVVAGIAAYGLCGVRCLVHVCLATAASCKRLPEYGDYAGISKRRSCVLANAIQSALALAPYIGIFALRTDS